MTSARKVSWLPGYYFGAITLVQLSYFAILYIVSCRFSTCFHLKDRPVHTTVSDDSQDPAVPFSNQYIAELLQVVSAIEAVVQETDDDDAKHQLACIAWNCCRKVGRNLCQKTGSDPCGRGADGHCHLIYTKPAAHQELAAVI